jgi:hypothetical protein
MNNELYVSRWHESVIEVYDVATLNHRRDMLIPGVRCVVDLASCPQCDVVYISDECTAKIYTINEHGVLTLLVDDSTKDMDSRTIHLVHSEGLSVNTQLNAVIPRPSLRDIRVYTPGGELIRNITVPSDVTELRQAIQLDDDRFVVVHGGSFDDVHRVCIVNSEGTIIQSFGGHKGLDIEQLNGPHRMLIAG